MNFHEKIDYSALSTYLTCPRRFLFQYVLNRKPAGQSIHLVFDSCWHYGLESTNCIYICLSNFQSPLNKQQAPSIKKIKSYDKFIGKHYWKRRKKKQLKKFLRGFSNEFS